MFFFPRLHGSSKRVNHFTVFLRSNHSGSSDTILSDQDRIKLLASVISNSKNLAFVRRVHGDIIRSRILDQHKIPFLWNNIMRSYIRHNSPLDTLHVYLDMVRSNVVPDKFTLPIMTKAATQIHDFPMGKQLHSVALKLGLVKDEFCESGFITLYSKAGEFEYARKVFDENPERKLASWNAMINGLNRAGKGNEAVEIFIEMKRNGFEPDDFTMVSVSSACGSLGDLNLGLQLHKCVLQARRDEKSDVMMMNSVLDVYGKCGRLDLARRVFDEMVERRSVVSWTSMITCYAANGETLEALECFNRMREQGVKPNRVTLLGVLTACVHGGLVEEGKAFFEMMKSEFGLEPDLSHYGCLVDLLSRDGQLQEARKVVEEMPMKPSVVIWGSLMGGCEKFGDVEMAESVAKRMLELEPWNDGVYVVLANVYALRGMWEDVERVRKMMKEKRIDKVVGYSSVTTSFD